MTARRVTPFVIPFRTPLSIAGGTTAAYSGVLVELCAGNVVGLGEAAASRPNAEALATELADLDLAARLRGRRVVDLLGGARRTRVPVNALLDAVDPDACARQASRCAARGFHTLKLKLHPTDHALNRRRVAAVRAAVGPTLALRADANAAWDVAQAVTALLPLIAFDLEYVEQPVRSIAELAELRRTLPVRLAADESATDPAAVEAIAVQHAADVVVLKPTRFGLRSALEMAAVACRRGLDVVITSALDSGIGIAAALQLACAVDTPRACGLATGDLLAGDLVEAPPHPLDGWMTLPSGPGLGVCLDRVALHRWARCQGVDARAEGTSP